MERIGETNLKILRQINLWAWLACVLPLTALSGLWFSWSYGSQTILNIIMVVGGTTMFVIAVVWWWWALNVMKHLLSHWELAGNGIKEISVQVKEIKTIVKEVIPPNLDK